MSENSWQTPLVIGRSRGESLNASLRLGRAGLRGRGRNINCGSFFRNALLFCNGIPSLTFAEDILAAPRATIPAPGCPQLTQSGHLGFECKADVARSCCYVRFGPRTVTGTHGIRLAEIGIS